MLDAETDQATDHNDNMTAEEAEVLGTLHNTQKLTKPDIQVSACPSFIVIVGCGLPLRIIAI